MFLMRIGSSLVLTLVFMYLSWLPLTGTYRPASQDLESHLLASSEPLSGVISQTSFLISPTVTTPFVKNQNFSNKIQPFSGKAPAQPQLTLFGNDYDSGAAFVAPYLSDSDRMGYGKASSHDASVLGAGWYVDWAAQANPPHPGGAEYARTIVLNVHDTGVICGWAPQPATQHWQVTPTLTGTALIQNVQANPGALWLIGNEPDAIYNGSPIQAELYAELYHDLYTIIKSADPTAKVAIGAIVQPSPLRLAYLDRVLNHYQAIYSSSLPVDVWNTHFYILNEDGCEWGASEPPFVPGPGWQVNFTPSALLDLPGMANNLKSLRQWMYDRGYGDKPLIITEYGVLPTPDLGFSNQLAAQFLRDMSTLFLTSADPVIGYAPDGNRLVQKWAWFSTNYPAFGGDLFDTNGNLTVIGQAFIQERNAHFSPYADLQPIPPLSALTTTNSLSLTAFIQNKGNASGPQSAVRIALLDAVSGLTATQALLNLPLLQPRYAQLPTLIDHTWHITFSTPPTYTIPYTLSLSIASDDANSANNNLALPIHWWPVSDLAVSDLTLSTNPVMLADQPASVVVTATVVNSGLLPTPQTPFTLTIQAPNGQTLHLLTNALVLPLQPAQSQLFTATLLISQSGSFTLSALLPDPLGPPEITNNNRLEASLISISPAIFLPLVRK